MNLIVNRPLDQAEKQLIYELTLKKRKSKKCHMSASQMLARQQLAMELLPHQRICGLPSVELFDSSAASSPTSSSSYYTPSQSGDSSMLLTSSYYHPLEVYGGESTPTSRSLTTSLSTTSQASIISTSAISSASSSGCPATDKAGDCLKRVEADELIEGGGGPTSDGSLGSGCSFSRSDSSYSGSSQDSGVRPNQKPASGAAGAAAAEELSRRAANQMDPDTRQTNIKLNKIKLEHLNEELERRLYQYQYLVAQEKALLGSYNMMLFTNEGCNNFHNVASTDNKWGSD